MRGCVNAFVQLFELSHRPPVCVNELAQIMFSIPDDRLQWVSESLVQCELLRRRADWLAVYNECLKLATYFEDSGDIDQCIQQHRLGLMHCGDSMDRRLEGTAHENFGLLFERLERLDDAIVHHETHLKLAEVVVDYTQKQKASNNLVRVYMKKGEKLEEACHFSDAKDMFEKAMNTAKASGDNESEGKAYDRLGRITVLLGDLHKALEYKKRFLLVSRQSKNGHAEAMASAHVAQLQQELGQVDDAVQSLKHSLAVAEENNDLLAICMACKQLGQVYSEGGQHVKAVHYFKENFRVATDMKDPEQVKAARIALGFAQGKHLWTTAGGRGFIPVVTEENKDTLLQWKTNGEL
jgi:tetratricopeptide (TPR) repeat protein